MKKSFVTMMAAGAFALTGVVGSATTEASTVEVAYWAFNNQSLPGGGFGWQVGDLPQPADLGVQAGSATIMLGGGDVLANDGAVYTWIRSFAGSTVNAQFGEPSGGSLSVQGGAGEVNNGAFLDISFDGTLWEGLTLSFAGRGTSTGFGSAAAPNTVLISSDGGVTFNPIATYESRQTSFQLYSFDVSDLDLVSDAVVRIVFDGGTSSSGNNRIDNLLVSGTLIPEPASLALLGLGSLLLVGRRR